MKLTNPTISVIVNTTDRAEQLHTLLRALEQQSYPHFEVVVVVGPTQDNTLEVLAAYQDRVRVLRCPQANLSQSRNIGLLAARGEVVAFIDDDAVPAYHWLAQLARLFENPDLDATGGTVFFTYPSNWMPGVQYRTGTISALLEQMDVRDSKLESLVPSGESAQWVERMMGANMAFRRSAILDIGGFDEFYVFVAEEADVAMRLAHAGKTVSAVREAYVYHVPASSRNRVVFTYTGRWWLQTRSGVYYIIKNGPRAGDPWRVIAERSLMLAHGHWLWAGQLYREGKVSWRQLWKIRLEEIYGLLAGVSGGLLRRRQLISEQAAASALQSSEPIRKFQKDNGKMPLPLDPITGHQPERPSEDPLRICLISYTYPPTKIDGVGRLTHLMARGLYENGHIVHVITHGEKEKVSFYDGAYVHEIPYDLERYGRYRRFHRTFHGLNNSHAVYERVKSLILNEGIQIVDSPLWLYAGLVTEVSGQIPVVVRLVTALRQVSAIQNEHDADTRMMGEMEGLLIKHADHLLPNTRATLKAVREVYGMEPPEDRYTIVPYGIIAAPEAEVRPFDPQQHTDPFNVLFVGRLEKRKGIADLFAAIPKVVQRFPNVRFTIAGADNSMHDGFAHQTGMDYPTYFARTYPDYAAFVRFTGGVSEAELQTLYQGCDLFVAPSLYESFGLVYLEAMNYAKPVIGCRAGGVPEVIDDGVTGLLVEPEAPENLADAIVELLSSPERLRRMGLAARECIVRDFTYRQMAHNFASVYRRVIESFQLSRRSVLLEETL